MSSANESRTLITIATYNEIENLPLLVDEVFQVVPDVDLLVIDDGSPDGTGRWCDERALHDHRVHVLHRSGKLGLGSATIAAMQYGIDHGYQFVLNMDADFSHHPRYLPALLAGMGGDDKGPIDVMIGSRYVPGGGTRDWPWRRKMMSRGVNLYARLLLGLKTKDCSGAFRCYRVDLLKRLNFDAIRSKGYSFQEEVLWHLKQLGARFCETPIIFADREKGSSKINSNEARKRARNPLSPGSAELAKGVDVVVALTLRVRKWQGGAMAASLKELQPKQALTSIAPPLPRAANPKDSMRKVIGDRRRDLRKPSPTKSDRACC